MVKEFGELENQILVALPAREYQRLMPHLEVVDLEAKQVLSEPGDRVTQVYFPRKAMFSLVSIMENGATVEVALIGREGIVGALPLLGDGIVSHRVVVQLRGQALRMNAETFKDELSRGGSLYKRTLLHTQALFFTAGQNAVCNRLHTIDQRLARWLLAVQDGVQSDEFHLTQEFIAEMIGIRRSSVTVAATLLQQAGIIRYSRGHITVLNRTLLKAASCECYKNIQLELNRLLNVGLETPNEP